MASLSDSESSRKPKLGENPLIKQQLEALKQFSSPMTKIEPNSGLAADHNDNSAEYASEKSSSEWGESGDGQEAGPGTFKRRRSTASARKAAKKSVKTGPTLELPANADAYASNRDSQQNKSEKDDVGVVDIAVDLPPKSMFKQQKPPPKAPVSKPEETKVAAPVVTAEKSWP